MCQTAKQSSRKKLIVNQSLSECPGLRRRLSQCVCQWTHSGEIFNLFLIRLYLIFSRQAIKNSGYPEKPLLTFHSLPVFIWGCYLVKSSCWWVWGHLRAHLITTFRTDSSRSRLFYAFLWVPAKQGKNKSQDCVAPQTSFPSWSSASSSRHHCCVVHQLLSFMAGRARAELSPSKTELQIGSK